MNEPIAGYLPSMERTKKVSICATSPALNLRLTSLLLVQPAFSKGVSRVLSYLRADTPLSKRESNARVRGSYCWKRVSIDKGNSEPSRLRIRGRSMVTFCPPMTTLLFSLPWR